MSKNAIIVIYVLAMIVTVVIIDLLFFKHLFRERLLANIGIVLVYTAFYLAVLKNR